MKDFLQYTLYELKNNRISKQDAMEQIRRYQNQAVTEHKNPSLGHTAKAGLPAGTVMLEPVWDTLPVEKGVLMPKITDTVVIAGGMEENISLIKKHYPKAHILKLQAEDTINMAAKKLEHIGEIDHIFWIAPYFNLDFPLDEMLIKAQEEGAILCMRLIKAFLLLGYGSRELGWSVITTQAQPISKKDAINPAHASIHGLIGTMAKEYPDWRIRLVDLEAQGEWPLANILELPSDRRGHAWVYRNMEWYRQQLVPVQSASSNEGGYKTGGVYVVIGGAGGVGEAWSEYMIKTYKATILWIGRREKDSAIQQKIDRLTKLGPAPIYISADATDLKSLEEAYKEIKIKYSKIDGLVHSALVFSEQSLESMEEKEFRAALSAKIDVSVRLAQVFQKESLDFILFFSSLISCIKNPRQGHYAAGCTFKDAFAHRLSMEWPSSRVKVMNWGFWHTDAPDHYDVNNRLAKIGIGLIEPPEAMKALETLMTAPVEQMGLMKILKPLEIEGVNVDEQLKIYSGNIGSYIDHINIPKQEVLVENMKTERRLQMKAMDKLLLKLLLGQLQTIGLFTSKNDKISGSKAKKSILDLYGRWFEESISSLVRNNYLAKDGELYYMLQDSPVDMESVWKEWDASKEEWFQDSDAKGQVVLVEATLRVLPEILTGKILATDIMFPNSSMELVEGIYKHNRVSKYYNEILADSVVAYIQERIKMDSSVKIRILEIGAGTGGTSAVVFQKLKPYHAQMQEYCYTDISKAFLIHAEKEYGPSNPYLTYKLFNISESAVSQGIDTGAYDIVIGANVLHATPNICKTLRNAKAALKKQGLLILNEVTGNSLFAHLTFGLLEGWWLYEDQALRIPGCPGIYPKTWAEVLEREGFSKVIFPVMEAHDLGQQIIVAESDGVVRQKKQIKKAGNKVLPVARESLNKPKAKKTFDLTGLKLEEHINRTIMEKLSESLRVDIDRISLDEPFAEYGLDSIIGVNLIQVINEALSIELKTTNLFDYSTVNKLSAYILANFKDRISAVLKEDIVEEKEVLASDVQEKSSDYEQSNKRRKISWSRNYFINKEKSSEMPSEKDSIAVIGISGQFPDSNDVDAFWQNLIKGHDAIHELPSNYLDQSKYFSSKKQPGKTYCKWGGILKDRDCFDPLFFNISPREAESMSPHQRLILQEGWKALEDAGYNPKGLADSKIGMFIGAEPTGYSYESFTGSSDAIIASRLSYYLDLKGPAITVNTGCSSSGVAIQLACESIRSGESSCAIAGGVFAKLEQDALIAMSDVEIVSPTGICHTFDDSADGTVFSESVGVVVLKPLKDAVRDGDFVYGVIKGSGMNQDGASNGITAPNGVAQEQLITGIYNKYGINPEDISYIEAHGTGTKLGDPVEANALVRAFRQYTNKEGYCAVGSSKSNIGHTAAAAGVVGLIKVLLSMRHHKIPGLIHFKKMNQYIDFEHSAFYVASEPAEWKSEGNKPLMAAISSFGHSGTNVHFVVEEYIAPNKKELDNKGDYIIPLSAKNNERLMEYAEKLLMFLKNSSYGRVDRISLNSMAYTLQTAREAMEERLAFVVKDIPELIEKLENFLEGREEIQNCFIGHVKQGKNVIRFFTQDEDMQEVVEKWIEKGKIKKIADLWTKGLSIDWDLFYEKGKPRRIPLPTYPFAKEHYWIPVKDNENKSIAAPSVSEVLMLQPSWRELAILKEEKTCNYSEHVVMLCEADEALKKRIEDRIKGIRCIILNSKENNIEERYENYVVQVFEEIKNILKSKPSGKVLLQIAIPTQGEQQLFSGLLGLLKTARLENPKLVGQLVEIDSYENFKGIIEALNRASNSVYNRIRYKDGKAYSAGWSQVEPLEQNAELPWKDEGVYLITGGAGGLGLIFAEDIASKVKNPKVILTGRSALSSEKQDKLKALEALGATVEYKQGDIASYEGATGLIDSIKSAYGSLNGIIHSAGIIKDSFIFNKAQEEIKMVLAPKVKGTVNLDQASRELNLDFFVLFSSVSGALGNIGQGDYSTANAFMDAFASYRNAMAASKKRYGKTLSINWPLWKDGGMGIDQETEKILMNKYGIAPMETYIGINSFYQGLALNMGQVVIMPGDPQLIKEKMFLAASAVVKPKVTATIPQIEKVPLIEKVQDALKEMAARLLDIKPEDLDTETELEECGFDLVKLTELIEEINHEYKIELSFKVLLGAPTLKEIANFLIKDYKEVFEKQFGIQVEEASIEKIALEVEPGILGSKTTEKLKELVGEATRLSAGRIDTDEPLESYGIDSIVITQLNEKLGVIFGDISKTLFYEYQTIGALRDYFVAEHHQKCMEWTGIKKSLPSDSDESFEMHHEVIHFDNGSKLEEALEKDLSPYMDKGIVELRRVRREPIAIIGMSGRYPKAKNLNEYWNNLVSGRDCVTEIPEERWSVEGFYHPDKQDAAALGKSYNKWGGFVDGFADFDPLFFNISPKEAVYMDPQERLFVESCFEAMEDAGYTKGQLAEKNNRRVGVFAGVTKSGFNLYGPDLWKRGEQVFPQTMFGSVANRVSYLLNLQGPSMPIDTMCSASLTAIHEACEHIYNGECEMAIAGGVNLYLHPSSYVIMSSQQMLSSDGKCKSFGQGGNGFVPGEGVGVIILKPLSKAVADRDNIYAVIRGTSINHGGKTNGYTVPNPIAQGDLIRTALDKSGVNARTVSYIEAHGTGTELGDPIEITGLTKAFRKDTQDKGFCAIGSVKTNIGHLESAAGIAGVAKVVLQMKNKKIVPSLHSKQLNKNINFNESPFVVQQELEDWKRPTIEVNGEAREYPRIAGVSSFGAGGSNAHVVIEEYIAEDIEKGKENNVLIVLSAKGEDQLRKQGRQLLAAVREKKFSDADLPNIAYTLQVGREAMDFRLAFPADSIDSLAKSLDLFDAGETREGIFIVHGKKSKGAVTLFQEDEDAESFIKTLIENGNLERLAELWVKGLDIDWNQLYTSVKPKRISLPTYPFDRKQYWIKDANKNSEFFKPLEIRKVKEEASELMTFQEVWQEETIPEPIKAVIKTIVCFISKDENRQEILEGIKEYNQNQVQVVFISQGNDYSKISDKEYQIIRSNPDSYKEAFLSIREDFGDIDGILYLWALEDESCITDYSCIVWTLQAIKAAKLKVREILLAAHLKDSIQRCYLESWIGFQRSLLLVLPGTKMCVLFQETTEEIPIKDWFQKLLLELRVEEAESVKYLHGKRNVLRIQPVKIQKNESILRPFGTYLITGGCGGLGLLFAEYIAAKHPVNLILTGRSQLDSKKQLKIKELEDMGSRVIYIQADICDSDKMNEGLSRAKKNFGEINGVIHSAGVTSAKSIFEKDIMEFEKVAAPKTEGTLILDKLISNEHLDFICCFSSSSAILGDFGSCDYAVANRFQMAYASYRNKMEQQGKCIGRAVAINWPLWRDGGMGFDNEDDTQMYLKSSGQRLLEREEGTEIFDDLLVQNNDQYLVMAGEPSRVKRSLGLIKDKAPDLKITVPLGKGRRAEMKGLSVEQCIEWDIKEKISQLLQITRDKLDVEENLADFGFDSISLASFAKLLTDHYEIEVTPSLFYGYSTIEKLTQYFLSKHYDAICEFYGEEAPVETSSTINEAVYRPQRIIVPEPAKTSTSSYMEPIAIIGMSGLFPDARNIDEMWGILESGQDVIKEIPEDRAYLKGADRTNWKCGWIPGVSEFDPLFFEISPREAEGMDPRQRLLLQEAWKAMEDAGYGNGESKSAKTGMFVGVEDGSYQLVTKDSSSITSNHNAILAARLSYFLNLSGPNMAINTACSSGLVAAHQACMSLRNQECDMAIAAGTALILAPAVYEGMKQAGMLSEDGRCYAFDKRANGLVPGEAVAVVVLKPLSKAKADGDRIYSVIRGSGINYDGKTNGITAPSGVSQANLMKSVYDKHNINPEEIEYIVTHGTGTKLGDPIEINALNDAFKEYTTKQGYCAITSTKTNFGHTMAASGLVSLISLVQALKHKTIPASLHCHQENDYINWKGSPFYVNKSNKIWDNKNGKNRIGAVSSFGMSGTNVHMVVESYSMDDNRGYMDEPPYHLLALSAMTEEALQEKVTDMISALQNKTFDKKNLPSVSYTLLEGRRHYNYRCAVVIQDTQDAVYVLKQAGLTETHPNLFKGKVPRNFSGQKAIEQYGRDMLKQSRSLQNNIKEYKEVLYALADLYCQGYELPWEMLYGEVKPCKIGVPAYPFARERYWGASPDGEVMESYSNATVEKSKLSEKLECEAALSEHMETTETLMFEPIWEERMVNQNAIKPDYADYKVMLLEIGGFSPESIENQIHGVSCIAMQMEQENIDERFKTYAVKVFEEIQSILTDKHNNKVLVQIVVPNKGEKQLFSGLSGLLKTAQFENPKLIGQVIEVEEGEGLEGIIEKLKESSLNPSDKQIRYKNGKRFAAAWREVEAVQGEWNIPWKERGVYLITGGSGGLGLIFAKEIAHRVKGAVLILTGRSVPKEDKETCFKELEALGARVEYKQVDAAKKEEVGNLIQSILENFGDINGIIHAAGVIHDNFIFKKTAEEFQKVLEPKVTGLVNLDAASKDIKLDFFILFSSVAGALGNAGQADYSAANAFMDGYAAYRNSLTATRQRYGKTLSINWPLWEEGGMHMDAEAEKIMKESMGIGAMKTPSGIEALYQSLASGRNRVMVIEGNPDRIRQGFLSLIAPAEQPIKSSSQNKEVQAIPQELFMEKAVNYFKRLISSVIKLPTNRIEVDAPMEKYGIDSLMVMNLTNQLEKIFGSLSKTLFFEYKDIQSLTGYFADAYRDKLMELLGINEKAEVFAVDSKEIISNKNFDKLPLSNQRKEQYIPAPIEPQSGKSTGLEDIAIIGVSGRYPGAENVNKFWENLKNGKDSITEIPKGRWDHSLYFDEDKNKPGKTNSKWGGFIEDVDRFDPAFFNISPREAEIIDPQERLFIQCVHETLEDAGYTRETLGLNQKFGLGGNVGVYVGVTYQEYQLYGAQEQIQGRMLTLIGNPASIANRVSYFCNFHGPSIAVDTMCSSSLTAVHLACQSLQSGDCEYAIAGGVNVSIHPNKYLLLGQGKFASSKGRCESFGQGGDGYVPGEGIGAILLKPLSKAIADGDQIYGVIKGTAINHGGKTNGYTVPNPNAQAEVIGRAFKNTGINPRIVSYIEAHGTGTSLGDPIEITGLAKAFQEYTKDKQFCAIGSAKSNIGHCESAAGIAGVTKVLLQLKHKQLVPSLHSEVLNPNIDFINTPFVVQQELVDWKRPVIEIDGKTTEYPRIAGISAFGAGGSNAHVIIEEFIPEAKERPSMNITPQNPAIIVLSAKNEDRLKKQARQLLDAVEEQKLEDSDLGDVAYTLQVGREAMEERLAMLVGNMDELKIKLTAFVEEQEDIADFYRGNIKRNRDTLVLLAADEDLQMTVDAWIRKGKYAKLLDCWVKGMVIDWNKFYNHTKPHRISLPTYPFVRNRYWVPKVNNVIEKPVKKEEGQSTGLQLSLQPVGIKAQVESLDSQKPRGILLKSIWEEQTASKKPNIEIQQLQIDPKVSDTVSVEAHHKGSPLKPGVSLEVLQEELKGSLANILCMNQGDVDVEDKFIDMGLDSITGVEWIQAINKQYGTSISTTKVYDYPTIREFTAFFLKVLDKGNNEINQKIVEPAKLESNPLSSTDSLLQQVSQQKPGISSEVLQEELKASFAHVLCMDQGDVDVEDKFIDMGLDSITGVEWIQAINKQYSTSISTTKVYDYPTIREFSAFFLKELSKGNKESNPSSSLQSLIQQVSHGDLNVEQADELLRQFHFEA